MRAKVALAIEQAGLVAILRNIEEEAAQKTVQALFKGGIAVMEVTLNTKGALATIGHLADTFGDKMLIGAGTVLDPEGAFAAINSGAEFLVTPTINPDVLKVANRYGKPVLAGAMTPTEVLEAYELGAEFVKLFPAGPLGPDYLKQIRGPLAHIPLFAVGGVTLENAAAFIRAGAVGLGLGGVLLDSTAITREDWDFITMNAQKFAQAVAQGRS